MSILLFGVACTQPSPAPASAPSSTDTQQPTPAPVETIVWDLIDNNPSGHVINVFLNDWTNDVYEKSGGRLRINVRAPGELPFSTSEYFDAVTSNSVQMASCMVTPSVGFLDEAGLTSGCFMITNLGEFNAVMEILEPYVQRTMDKHHLMNLFTISHHNQYLFGKGKLPSSVADMKGMLFRTGGSEQAKFWLAAGLSPVSMDNSEIASALNRNVINGIVTSVNSVETSKYYEVLDWQYIIKSQWLPIFTVVNLDAFNALPADVQQIMIETAEARLPSFHENIDKAYETSIERVGEYIETIYASPEEEAALRQVAIPVWETHAQSIGGDAPAVLEKIKKALNL